MESKCLQLTNKTLEESFFLLDEVNCGSRRWELFLDNKIFLAAHITPNLVVSSLSVFEFKSKTDWRKPLPSRISVVKIVLGFNVDLFFMLSVNRAHLTNSCAIPFRIKYMYIFVLICSGIEETEMVDNELHTILMNSLKLSVPPHTNDQKKHLSSFHYHVSQARTFLFRQKSLVILSSAVLWKHTHTHTVLLT